MSGAIAAAHAARKRREQHEEEEKMTGYKKEDLDGEWEFKIVRSESNVFRKPEVFRQLLEEEAIAGWQFLEKLDDMRVRFKRPVSARKKDDRLPEGIDPYRSTYGGMNQRLAIALVLAITILIIGVVMLAIFSNL
jgi:hypothetical protein